MTKWPNLASSLAVSSAIRPDPTTAQSTGLSTLTKVYKDFTLIKDEPKASEIPLLPWP